MANIYPPILPSTTPALRYDQLIKKVSFDFTMPFGTVISDIGHIQLLVQTKATGISTATKTTKTNQPVSSKDGVLYLPIGGQSDGAGTNANPIGCNLRPNPNTTAKQSYTIDINFEWFGVGTSEDNRILPDVEYTFQVRFGYAWASPIGLTTPTPPPNAGQPTMWTSYPSFGTAANFARWKNEQVVNRAFGEWANASNWYFLPSISSWIANNISYDPYASFIPEFVLSFAVGKDLFPGYVYKGQWIATAAYVKNDYVLGSDNKYYCAVQANTNSNPTTNTTNWKALPQKSGDSEGNAERIVQYRLEAGNVALTEWKNTINNANVTTMTQGAMVISEQVNELILKYPNGLNGIRFHYITNHMYEGYSNTVNYDAFPLATTTTPSDPNANPDRVVILGVNKEEAYVSLALSGDLFSSLNRIGQSIQIYKCSSTEPTRITLVGQYVYDSAIPTLPTQNGTKEIARDFLIEAGTWNYYFAVVQTNLSAANGTPAWLICSNFWSHYITNPAWTTYRPAPFTGKNTYNESWLHIEGFEYNYLTAKDCQLKMPYNDKVSGFKINVQEQITSTIGSRYPFVSRSGNNYYRSFSFSSVISINSDFSFLFLKRIYRPGINLTAAQIKSMMAEIDYLTDEISYLRYTNYGLINTLAARQQYDQQNGILYDWQTYYNQVAGVIKENEKRIYEHNVRINQIQNLIALDDSSDAGKFDLYFRDKPILYYEQLFGRDTLPLDYIRSAEEQVPEQLTPFHFETQNQTIEKFDLAQSESQVAQVPAQGFAMPDYGNIKGPKSLFDTALSPREILQKMTISTDLSYSNIEIERKFREVVMSFLYDGKPKLWRSSQEGNILVYVSNISISPFDAAHRMVAEMQFTLTEIAPANSESLFKYGILSGQGGLNFE